MSYSELLKRHYSQDTLKNLQGYLTHLEEQVDIFLEIISQGYNPETWDSCLLYHQVYLFTFSDINFDFSVEFLSMDLNLPIFEMAVKTYNMFFLNYLGLINTPLNLYSLEVKLNQAYTILTLYPIQCEGFPDYFIFDYLPGISHMF